MKANVGGVDKWLRTALGLIAAGVAVLHLLEPMGQSGTRTGLGIALLIVGAATAIVGVLPSARFNRPMSE